MRGYLCDPSKIALIALVVVPVAGAVFVFLVESVLSQIEISCREE